MTAISASALTGAPGAPPLGAPGTEAIYRYASEHPLRSNCVERVTLNLGPVESSGVNCQWLVLRAEKANGQKFAVWLLSSALPGQTVEQAAATSVRYILQEGDETPHEFVNRVTGAPVLPSIGGWKYLWPRDGQDAWRTEPIASEIRLLGHRYVLESKSDNVSFPAPPGVRKLALLPDTLVGVPSNKRTKEDARRFDGSDYAMVRLTRENYTEMIRAGLNCFNVDAEQANWLKDEPVFYWGVGGNDVPFPECLYGSTYLGPALFLDEPAVGTRDYDIRPRLAKDADFRRALNPQIVLDEFKRHYHKTVAEGAPTALFKSMQARSDIDLGAMDLTQRNLYSWETMIASSVWELTAEPEKGPRAIVFEPPGRLGSRRTLPEMNMSYGCQLSLGEPGHFADIVFGFLRGAARVVDKDWGVSIYGAVDQSDAPWLLTHAYDLGATHFFFWDNYQLACVPYTECLSLARHLQAHIQSHPERNLARLKRAAEVAILLPPGYDLGHTHMGRGNLWGLPELNLERTNRFGVTYRQVMGNFFTEIERCFRLEVAFDLLWDLDGLKLDNYREIVRVLEDGRVEIIEADRHTMGEGPRIPVRPDGKGPDLEIELSNSGQDEHSYSARVRLKEGSAPVYYTTGADRNGVFHNVLVLWELFGPGVEDYRQLSGHVVSTATAQSPATVETQFRVDHTGRYRLRAASADTAGRTKVVWREINVP